MQNTISTIDFSTATSLARGKECFLEEKFSDAAGLFSLALINDPNNAEAYRYRAEAYFRLEEYQKSFDDASHALTLSPDDPVALFRRGTVLAMHGHPEEALQDMNRLLERDRDHIEGLLRRFWIFVQLGQPHAADEDLRTLLVTIPDETPIQFHATQVCLQTGRLDAARTLLSSIITRESENVEALKLRGLVWRHLGAPDMAVSDFSYAVDAGGASAELLVERALSFIEMGKRTLTKKAFRYALEDLDRVLDEFSDQLLKPAVVLDQRALAWTHFAERCWFDKSGYQKALGDFAEAIARDPEFVDALFHRASLHWKLEHTTETIEDCDRILQFKPDHEDALHLRAEAFLKRKEPEKAEADFQKIDRIHAAMAEKQTQAIAENRKSCDDMDCSRFCRK